MLTKNYRLRNGRDIARVYSRGRYIGGGDFSLKVLKTNLPISRAVVVVGKKVSKKATLRNRLRRRLTAILASKWATVQSGYDIVITVHRDLEHQSSQDLTDRLTKCMGTTEILGAAMSKKLRAKD